jgi:hypothetical protein
MGQQFPRRPAREAIDDLLARPPVNAGELARRLQGVEPSGARREIVDRLQRGDVPSDELDVLAAAMLHVGVGDEMGRLEALVLATDLPRSTRWIAMSILLNTAPHRVERVFDQLDPDDRLRLMLEPAVDAARNIQAAPELARWIAESLTWIPPAERREALAYIDDVRRGAGTPAALAYREVLRREAALPLIEMALEAVVEEGGAEAQAEVARLRDQASSPALRQAFQRALLRMGTRAIEPSRRPLRARGTGLLGSCDGQGAFLVAGCFENPDGTSSFASLCVRVGADLRNAFTVPAITDAERVSLIEGMCMGGISDVAPIDLAGAAEIVFEGLDRTRAAGLPVPADATAAIAMFERARDPAQKLALAVPSAAPPTLAEGRSLLELPVYQSWFFDRGDLAAAGVDLAGASSGKPKAAWVRRALERLAASEARPRLAAMLRHMAAWHALRGEVDKAALCSAAGAEVEARFAEGALPRAMLERSIKALKALEREAAEKAFGDPAVRGRLRIDFFHAVESPKGRDLAALDFCEVAYLALDTWLSLLPVNQRPRDRDVAAAAFEIARLFAGGGLRERPTFVRRAARGDGGGAPRGHEGGARIGQDGDSGRAPGARGVRRAGLLGLPGRVPQQAEGGYGRGLLRAQTPGGEAPEERIISASVQLN